MSSKAIYVVTVDASRYENRALRFWLRKIRQYASKPCVFVVASHADLLPDSALRYPHANSSSVTSQIERDLADAGVPVLGLFFVSALSGDGIGELRQALFREVSNPLSFPPVPGILR